MPIQWLDRSLDFPEPAIAEDNGLFAVGGDLSVQRLLRAYQIGAFPWFNENDPILWWHPNPRYVIYPSDIYVSKSMRQILRRDQFTITYDQEFDTVVEECSGMRREGQAGTWLTKRMRSAYKRLHQAGYAHSCEVWLDGELVGGLYGVSIGRAFYGESMFTKASNASKVALIHLARNLEQRHFYLIDCQMPTPHLISMGATPIPRLTFRHFLKLSNSHETIRGSWDFMAK